MRSPSQKLFGDHAHARNFLGDHAPTQKSLGDHALFFNCALLNEENYLGCALAQLCRLEPQSTLEKIEKGGEKAKVKIDTYQVA